MEENVYIMKKKSNKNKNKNHNVKLDIFYITVNVKFLLQIVEIINL